MPRVHFRHAHDRDVVGRDNAAPYAGKVYAFFFFHSITRHVCIFHGFMFKHRGESRGDTIVAAIFLSRARATLHRGIAAAQIGFLNVPFPRNGWLDHRF